MSANSPVAAYNTGRGFPIKTNGFIMDKAPVIRGHRAFVLHIPAFIFYENAKSFANYNPNNFRGRAFYIMLQLWLFVLHVLQMRITRNLIKSSEFPVKVYLETLLDAEQNPTNDHRLWIFESDKASEGTVHSITKIFKQAVLSNKRVDPTGSFLDFADNPMLQDVKVANGSVVAGSANHGMGNGSSHLDSAGNMSAKKGGSGSFMDFSRLKQHEMYYKVDTTAAYARLADVYINQIFYARNNEAMYDEDVTNPDKIFNIETAMKLTSTDVGAGQRDIKNYQILSTDQEGEETYVYTLPFFAYTFCLPMFVMSPPEFLYKYFPYTQIDKKQMQWSEFMQRLAKQSLEKEKLHKQKIKQKKNNLLNGNLIGSSQVSPVTASATIPPVRNRHDPDDIQDEYDRQGMTDNERHMQNNAELNNIFANVQPMTDEMIEEITSNLSGSSSSSDTIMLNDFVAHLGHLYTSEKFLITDHYKDSNPQMFRDMKAQLRDVFYDKFAMYCMDEHSEVSKAQQSCNAYFKKKNLDALLFTLPITDPSRSVIENFIIWHSESLHELEGVATSNKNITFGYMLSGDRWRREFGDNGLHLNLIFTGTNATSKTTAMQKILTHIHKDSCIEINTWSLLADAIDDVSTDNVYYTDDGTMAGNFKNAGDESSAKSHRTTQVVTRAVLEIINNGGKTERKKKIYKNLQICIYIMCTNETRHDLESLSNAQAESVKALYYRYVPLEAVEYDCESHSVPGMQAKMDAIDDTHKEDLERFRDFDIKFHTICGWLFKLWSISPDLFSVDMTQFGDMWTRLTHKLPAEHKRVRTQVYLFAQQMCILECYLINHCVVTGPYYNQPLTFIRSRIGIRSYTSTMCLLRFPTLEPPLSRPSWSQLLM